MARTWNVCSPNASPVYSPGEAHPEKATPSSEHSKVEPDSFAEKMKITLASVVVATGPESIVVSGGVASTIQVALAGVGSVFSDRSTARTLKTCPPSLRPLYSAGETQVAKAAPSSEH